jgi:hypothetical protein
MANRYIQKGMGVDGVAIPVHTQQDDLGTVTRDPIVFNPGKPVILYTFLSDGQNKPEQFFVKIDRRQVGRQIIPHCVLDQS